jgi:hypothetical protein
MGYFLFGPRGSGKSTLLHEEFPPSRALWFDLLDPDQEAEFQMHPNRLLERWRAADPRPGWIVIDEVQKAPKILDLVHLAIERHPVHFALTGSSARKLKRGVDMDTARKAVLNSDSTAKLRRDVKQTYIKLFLALFFASRIALPSQASAYTDNIDLPFKDDPAVLGRWKSVDFVPAIEVFVPNGRRSPEQLFLKGLAFLPEGKTETPGYTWTQGVLIKAGYRTASKYVFKTLGGQEYMFLEWKAGDYVLRDRKPEYYVLTRDEEHGAAASRSAAEPPIVESFTDCVVSSPLGGICKHPFPQQSPLKPLSALPRYDRNSENIWQLDLRGCDLSGLSLQDRSDDLLHASFDTRTRFPEKLPKEFLPSKILELGKNPGLGVRSLHRQGLTGRGAGIAIIDQSLFVDHPEYSAGVKSYEEMHWLTDWETASMHAGAVASIAAGKHCGVAPGADVYFIANRFTDSAMKVDYTHLAAAVDRVIAFNKAAPAGKKIRVLAIQRGFSPGEKGYEEIGAAIERAKAEGIFVITSSLSRYYGYKFAGLNREPLADPDSVASYGLGLFLVRGNAFSNMGGNTLLVPMDSRTTAGPEGAEDYAFYREGGFSWAIPYLAGLYALACEARPDITPELFWRAALDTGTVLTVKKDGKYFPLGKIANPVSLIARLKANRTPSDSKN